MATNADGTDSITPDRDDPPAEDPNFQRSSGSKGRAAPAPASLLRPLPGRRAGGLEVFGVGDGTLDGEA